MNSGLIQPTFASIVKPRSGPIASRTVRTRGSMSLGSPALEQLSHRVKASGFATIPETVRSLYDLAVLIGSESLQMDDEDFEDLDTSAMTPAQIVRAFKKTQSATKTNRRFVQTIVPFLA